jgi:hypothetical protein
MNLMGRKKLVRYDRNYLKAISYCIDNSIKIYPVPKSRKEYYLEVNDNGKIIRSPEAYNLKQWSDKIVELYTFYYYKHNPTDK